MVNWVNKAMAIGFGGVLDLEDNEEGLVSEFYNDLSVFYSVSSHHSLQFSLCDYPSDFGLIFVVCC